MIRFAEYAFTNCCAGLALTFCLNAAAQPYSEVSPAVRPQGSGLSLKMSMNTLELGHGRESLTNNYSDWTNTYLLGSRKLGERQILYGGLRETERFNLRDNEAHAGLYFPLSDSWGGGGRGKLQSDTRSFAPGFSLRFPAEKLPWWMGCRAGFTS